MVWLRPILLKKSGICAKVMFAYTRFQTITLERVNTEMSLHVLAYNLKRMMNIFGVSGLIEAIQA
jgi:uncharacterized protein YijF (DUF1287 family)